MKRLGVLAVVTLVASVGCKKDSDDNNPPKPAPSIQHGSREGKGTGGGDKSATGTMNGKVGTGKGPGTASGTGTGTASGTGTGTGTGAAPTGDPAIARGAYLATGPAACALCHTPLQIGPNGPAPDMSKAFAGGLSFKEKFGTWISPNITPDPDTGVGKWTDDQLVAAIRQGVRPDGSALHPIMPYMFYNKLTDDDAKAIVKFLRTVPPVVNKIELSKDLKRPPQGLPAPTGNVDDASDPLKHGEYLTTIMHCAACHTPMNDKGFDMSKMYAGGNPYEFPPEMHMGTGTLYSANITSDPDTGIGGWSEDDIVKSLRALTKKDGSPIFGPMQFYAGMWKNMTDADIAAVAKFVHTIPPIKNKVPASTYKPPAGPPPGPPPGGGSASGSAAPKVEHGKGQGKGTGGGGKTATGSKNSVQGSGKAPAKPSP